MLNNLTSAEDLAMYRNMLPQGDEARNAAARAVRAAAAQREAERPAARMRRKYEGPWRDRPVVNGRAMVSAEELADFRRLYGPQMTLRDLLNVDRGAGPSAADPRARGMQEAMYAPGEPGVIPFRGIAGPPDAGPPAAGRIPGEVERNIMNALAGAGPLMAGAVPLMAGMRAIATAGKSAPAATAQLVRDPRTGLPMRMVIPDVAPSAAPDVMELYLQGAPTVLRNVPRVMAGQTR